ncbi:MAG: hypothetical protein RLZZ628_704 [Bacteroidota bacterium]|jgi:hypothetical protein
MKESIIEKILQKKSTEEQKIWFIFRAIEERHQKLSPFAIHFYNFCKQLYYCENESFTTLGFDKLKALGHNIQLNIEFSSIDEIQNIEVFFIAIYKLLVELAQKNLKMFF